MSGKKSARMMACIALTLFIGCGGKPSNEKQVFKVTGKVTVDGNPVESLQVGIHDKAPFDQKQPTVPSGLTDAQGNLLISTYEQGDGLPTGEYVLTFAWQEFNVISRSFTGPDKLNKRYSDPAKSMLTVKVGSGPVELGEIKLTTK